MVLYSGLDIANPGFCMYISEEIAESERKQKTDCWTKDFSFNILFFSETEISNKEPLVCVAKGQKELVQCKTSGKKTYRRWDYNKIEKKFIYNSFEFLNINKIVNWTIKR